VDHYLAMHILVPCMNELVTTQIGTELNLSTNVYEAQMVNCSHN